MERVFMLFGLSSGTTGEDAADPNFLGDGTDLFVNLGLILGDHGLLGGDFDDQRIRERIVVGAGLTAGQAGEGERRKESDRGERGAQDGFKLHGQL